MDRCSSRHMARGFRREYGQSVSSVKRLAFNRERPDGQCAAENAGCRWLRGRKTEKPAHLTRWIAENVQPEQPSRAKKPELFI